jgi:hypothetical protein
MAVEPVRDDDRLLEALGAALRPPAGAEPSLAELAALQRAVAAGGTGAGDPRSAGVRRRLLAAVAVVVVGVSGGTAYANSPSAPRPVRSVAHAVKLPGVEAPDLTDARKALDDLAEELAEDRVRADDVRAELADLDEELAELSPGQLAGLEPRLSAVRGRAEAVLAAAAPAEAAEREDADEVEDADDLQDRLDDAADDADDAADEAEDRAEDEADVRADELDDSSGSGSSGSGSSGSSGSGSGSSGSGSGSGGSGSGSSGSGSSGSGGSGSGSDDGRSGP